MTLQLIYYQIKVIVNNLSVYYNCSIAHMQGTDIRDSHAGGPGPLWGPLIALRVTYG